MSRQQSSVLKLEYLDQLDPRQNDPVQVKQQIKQALDDGEFTLREIERFTSYKVPTISQALSGKYEADTDKIDTAMIRFWKNWIAKSSIVKTNAAQEVFQLLDLTWARKRVSMIVGDNGRGKSTAAQSYCASHPDYTVYTVCDSTYRLLEFFDELAKSLGIEGQMSGPASFRKAAIIRALQRKPRMIIIDEADEIKPRILSALRTIWADNEGRCAIVMIGTRYLETMMQQPFNHLRYMDTRVSLRLNVKEMDEDDAVKFIGRFPNGLERAEMKGLCTWANKASRTRGGMRALANLMSIAYDLAQSQDADEITNEHVETAKAMM